MGAEWGGGSGEDPCSCFWKSFLQGRKKEGPREKKSPKKTARTKGDREFPAGGGEKCLLAGGNLWGGGRSAWKTPEGQVKENRPSRKDLLRTTSLKEKS